jgi:drug/metabolite transporter (DMT)-like permease
MSSLHDPIIAVPVSYLVTALVAAGARFVVSKEPPTIRKILETLIASSALVIGAYPYLEEKGYGPGLMNLIVAAGSFAAKDILEAVLKLWEQLKSDPLALLREYLNSKKPGGDS